MSKKLFLLDAYALIYRAYYAFIRNPIYSSKGLNTSAILGFTNTLVEVLEKENPTHIAVAFDPSTPTFRNEIYEAYKANREEMPEDIQISIPYIKEILQAFNIPIILKEGYEADDVIGTLAHKAKDQGFETYMMTPDKDYGQLLEEGIYIYKPKRSGSQKAEILDKNKICEQFKIERPEQIIDIMALMGDKSDNIPGVPGIGEKTAIKLISRYGSIENIYKSINDVQGKQKEKLINNKDKVELSKELVKIKLNVPIEFNTRNIERSHPNKEHLEKLFRELEFKSLSRRLFQKEVSPANSGNAVQQSTFSDSTEQEKKEEAENTLA
ncbi:MAG: 5'-3' exonuclease, partial [Bacteroidota bacterium]